MVEVRCHHCEHRFVPVTAAEEVRCPRCGVMLLRHRAPAVPVGLGNAPHDLSRREMRRIFRPLPNSFLYFAGALLVALLTAPFWLGELGGKSGGGRILISDDVPDTTPSWSRTNEVAVAVSPAAGPVSPLDQFEGVQLGVSRDSLERRFSLYLKNTRGMVPEIYEAREARGLDRLVAYFYQDQLREFVVVMPARVSTPEDWLRMLRIQYGEPLDWSQGEQTPAAAGVPGSDGGRYERFGLYRHFIWSDGAHRLEATIFFTTPDPVVCESFLVVRGRMAEESGSRLEVPLIKEPLPSPVPLAPVAEPERPRLFP